jgi:hypothetical protein
MKAPELFGVIVRGVGLYFVVLGLQEVHGRIGIFDARMVAYLNLPEMSWLRLVASVALYFLAGFFLLKKADAIMTFAYTPRTSPPENSN